MPNTPLLLPRRIAAAVLDPSQAATQPYAKSAPLKIRQLELADPGPGEVLVRIDAAMITEHDLATITGQNPLPSPLVLGHEAAATVLALGSTSDTSLSVGDRCVLVPHPACGLCASCLSGQPYVCPVARTANEAGELLRGGTRLSEDGRDVLHHFGCAAFATQAILDRCSLVKIDPDIPAETAALFGGAMLSGGGAVMNAARLRAGESLTIVGAGAVGLCALMTAVCAGARPVQIIDPSPGRRALALELGATSARSPEDAGSFLDSDVVIEAVGDIPALEQAIRITRPGGRIVTLAAAAIEVVTPAQLGSLLTGSKTLIGCAFGSGIPARDIPRYIKLWRAGQLPVEKLLTSVGALEEMNESRDKFASGGAIRQVVVPGW